MEFSREAIKEILKDYKEEFEISNKALELIQGQMSQTKDKETLTLLTYAEKVISFDKQNVCGTIIRIEKQLETSDKEFGYFVWEEE